MAIRPWKSLVPRIWTVSRLPARRATSKPDDLRVVVRGRERVTGVEELGDVVVATAVLVGHRLAGVDVPDVDAGHVRSGRVVDEHVVERAGATAKL